MELLATIKHLKGKIDFPYANMKLKRHMPCELGELIKLVKKSKQYLTWLHN